MQSWGWRYPCNLQGLQGLPQTPPATSWHSNFIKMVQFFGQILHIIEVHKYKTYQKNQMVWCLFCCHLVHPGWGILARVADTTTCRCLVTTLQGQVGHHGCPHSNILTQDTSQLMVPNLLHFFCHKFYHIQIGDIKINSAPVQRWPPENPGAELKDISECWVCH